MTKREIIKAMEDLPEDASIEDAMERLYLIFRIERGLQQVEAGEVVSHEEAKARMSKWLQ
jgi:predicted transcriptional regulator